ncbi:hypothetical protein Bbelb_401600 [Branchiostoma belcheri]|nr:hypothetical protein Bbelb_401600 [Branchiostoma belcheri]
MTHKNESYASREAGRSMSLAGPPVYVPCVCVCARIAKRGTLRHHAPPCGNDNEERICPWPPQTAPQAAREILQLRGKNVGIILPPERGLVSDSGRRDHKNPRRSERRHCNVKEISEISAIRFNEIWGWRGKGSPGEVVNSRDVLGESGGSVGGEMEPIPAPFHWNAPVLMWKTGRGKVSRPCPDLLIGDRAGLRKLKSADVATACDCCRAFTTVNLRNVGN